jgi:hypothetical protein
MATRGAIWGGRAGSRITATRPSGSPSTSEPCRASQRPERVRARAWAGWSGPGVSGRPTRRAWLAMAWTTLGSSSSNSSSPSQCRAAGVTASTRLAPSNKTRPGGVQGLLLGDGGGQDGPPHPLGEQAARRGGGGRLLSGEVGPARAAVHRHPAPARPVLHERHAQLVLEPVGDQHDLVADAAVAPPAGGLAQHPHVPGVAGQDGELVDVLLGVLVLDRPGHLLRRDRPVGDVAGGQDGGRVEGQPAAAVEAHEASQDLLGGRRTRARPAPDGRELPGPDGGVPGRAAWAKHGTTATGRIPQLSGVPAALAAP